MCDDHIQNIYNNDITKYARMTKLFNKLVYNLDKLVVID